MPLLWKGEITEMEPRTYRVTKIDGDYAHLENVETGEDLLMARALLPDETDEGTMLHWENFVYTII